MSALHCVASICSATVCREWRGLIMEVVSLSDHHHHVSVLNGFGAWERHSFLACIGEFSLRSCHNPECLHSSNFNIGNYYFFVPRLYWHPQRKKNKQINKPKTKRSGGSGRGIVGLSYSDHSYLYLGHIVRSFHCRTFIGSCDETLAMDEWTQFSEFFVSTSEFCYFEKKKLWTFDIPFHMWIHCVKAVTVVP